MGANDGYYTMSFLPSQAERVVACEPGPVANLLFRNAGQMAIKWTSAFRLFQNQLAGDLGA